MKPGYLEKLPGVLKQFSTFLGNRKWFAGDKVCDTKMLKAESLQSSRFLLSVRS